MEAPIGSNLEFQTTLRTGPNDCLELIKEARPDAWLALRYWRRHEGGGVECRQIALSPTDVLMLYHSIESSEVIKHFVRGGK